MLLKGASLKVYRDGEKVILLCKFWRNYKIGRSKGQQDRYIFIEKLKFYFNFLCRNYWVPGIGILEIGIPGIGLGVPINRKYIYRYMCVLNFYKKFHRVFSSCFFLNKLPQILTPEFSSCMLLRHDRRFRH